MVVRVRARGEDIRRFIVENVDKHSTDIAAMAANKFSITRQAINKHLKNLASEGALTASGKTRNRTYRLCSQLEYRKEFKLGNGINEDIAWDHAVEKFVSSFPENVKDIWHYSFTEMFNNAIDHSDGNNVFLQITKTAANTQLLLADDGVGIFKKIQKAMNLEDERHAILDCAGKANDRSRKAHRTGDILYFPTVGFI